MEEKPRPQGPCTRCGELTDNKLGDVHICLECYQVRSSCCPEFGPDDLAANVCEDESKTTDEHG